MPALIESKRFIQLLNCVCLAVVVAGCGSSSLPQTGGPALGGGSPGSTTGSGWTTLGTREMPAAPSTPITSNAGAKWVDYNPAAMYAGVVTTTNQFITMKDGTRLAANVSLPADPSGKAVAGNFPTILVQTGYNKDAGGGAAAALGGADSYLVRHGYAFVVVDTRGTGRSEGEWESFGELEQSDYYTVADWLVQQPWSNGQFAVEGASLLAITASLTAAQEHPGLKAVFAIVPMGDSYRDIVFQGGELNVGFIPLWLGLVTGLGVIDTTIDQNSQEAVQAELDHVEGAVTAFQVPQVLGSVVGNPQNIYDNDFWKIRSPLDKAPQIHVPTFVIGGLHCIFQRGEPLMYEALKGHVPSKLLLHPGNHVEAAEGQGLPVDGVPIYDHIQLQWFDQYLKGMNVGAEQIPNVTQYVFGLGHYITATDWPHPQARAQRFYLRGDGSLSTQAPAMGETSNDVIQEPLNGLCSQSAAQWTAGLLGLAGVNPPCFTDDSLTQTLEVIYDTAPMAEDFYINGPIEADVWLSTTSQDAPVVVRVDDVDASGNAFALTTGIMQASLREVDVTKARYLDGQMIQPWHPFTEKSVLPVGSGNIVEVPVEIFPTSALIAKGHRLRVSVGASDFPHGLPPLPELINELPGVLTIYSDATHPSGVVVPVVPVDVMQ